jgi:hypothetical protein
MADVTSPAPLVLTHWGLERFIALVEAAQKLMAHDPDFTCTIDPGESVHCGILMQDALAYWLAEDTP